jgi:hypothetical protein
MMMASFNGKHRPRSRLLAYVSSERFATQTAIFHYRARLNLKMSAPGAELLEVAQHSSGLERSHILPDSKPVQPAFKRANKTLPSPFESSHFSSTA